MPENSDWMHRFTEFTINLNYLPDNLAPLIAPTDSRLSSTQRFMEEGLEDEASSEKNRLEEK